MHDEKHPLKQYSKDSIYCVGLKENSANTDSHDYIL